MPAKLWQGYGKEGYLCNNQKKKMAKCVERELGACDSRFPHLVPWQGNLASSQSSQEGAEGVSS